MPVRTTRKHPVMLFLAVLLASLPFAIFAQSGDGFIPHSNPGVCGHWETGSGKVDVEGNFPSLELTAPEGWLIAGYCVKAGSMNQEFGGPEYVSLDPAVKTVTISHSTGKNISHYSLYYVPAPVAAPQWCSPGYWRNHPEAWAATGIDPKTAMYNTYFAVPSIPGVTLEMVLNSPQSYQKLGGDPFNMVADQLSANHPDINFNGIDRYLPDGTHDCPLN